MNDAALAVARFARRSVHWFELLFNGGNAARFARGGIGKYLHTLCACVLPEATFKPITDFCEARPGGHKHKAAWSDISASEGLKDPLPYLALNGVFVDLFNNGRKLTYLVEAMSVFQRAIPKYRRLRLS